jgi:hypothetical protein
MGWSAGPDMERAPDRAGPGLVVRSLDGDYGAATNQMPPTPWPFVSPAFESPLK